MFKYFQKKKGLKEKEATKAENARKATIKSLVDKAIKGANNEMNFLVDIGSYKTRKKYKLSDREMEEYHEHILKTTANRAVALELYLFLCKEREAGSRKIRKGKVKPVLDDVNSLIKEFSK